MNQKMKTAPAAENKMGTMPVGKLVFNMSLPMMVSMLVQALYNVVDSVFVAQINEIIAKIHQKLTGGKESLQIIYEPSTGDLPFEQALKRYRDRDLRMKSTTVGPHRDDIGFLTGDMDIRRYGSQGQQRTAALSLKLAEIELVKKIVKDYPVLLLDDVLSELDSKRQEHLLSEITHIQTLITCTGLDEFVNSKFRMDKIFKIVEGTVESED